MQDAAGRIFMIVKLSCSLRQTILLLPSFLLLFSIAFSLFLPLVLRSFAERSQGLNVWPKILRDLKFERPDQSKIEFEEDQADNCSPQLQMDCTNLVFQYIFRRVGNGHQWWQRGISVYYWLLAVSYEWLTPCVSTFSQIVSLYLLDLTNRIFSPSNPSRAFV